MNPIFAALEAGYSPQRILSYLKKIDPDLALKINTALQAGYPIEHILSFLSKNGKKVSSLLGGNNKEENRNIYQQASRGVHPSLKQIGAFAGIMGAGALATSALTPQVARSLVPEVLGAVQPPSLPPKETVEIDATPKIAHQTKQIEFQPPNQLIEQAKVPEPPIAPQEQAQIPSQPSSQMDFGQVLDQLGVKNKVDALRESNPPEIVSKIIRYGLPKDQVKQLESQLQMPLDQLISGYLQSAPPVETLKEKIAKGVPFGQRQKEINPISSQPEIKPSIPQQKENRFKDLIEEGRQKFEDRKKILDIPEKPKDRMLKLERGSSVLLPDGNIGEIEDVKQGIAKVKVGDRIRNKKLEELMESPKEAAIAALELIKSFTPETLRSAHHALNTYDPVTKSAQFLFHSGEGYIVDDISPEEYERLSNEIEEAKTAGENKIGAWSTGSGSRGAAYQKIVKNLKKPYRKIQVGYNLFKEFQRLINEKEE